MKQAIDEIVSKLLPNDHFFTELESTGYPRHALLSSYTLISRKHIYWGRILKMVGRVDGLKYGTRSHRTDNRTWHPIDWSKI